MRDTTAEEKRYGRFLVCQIVAANNGPIERSELKEKLQEASTNITHEHIAPMDPDQRRNTFANQIISSAFQRGVIGEYQPERWEMNTDKVVLTDKGAYVLSRPSVSQFGVSQNFREKCSFAVWMVFDKFS